MSVPGVSIGDMNVTAALLVVIAVGTALAAGLALGWLLALHRSQVTTHASATELARLHAVLDAERTNTARREAAQARNEQQLREAFGSLSAEALARNNEAFVTLAESRLAAAQAAATGDLTQRQLAIETMVGPCASHSRRSRSSRRPPNAGGRSQSRHCANISTAWAVLRTAAHRGPPSS